MVAKLQSRSIPIEHIRKMTLYQAVATTDALNEEDAYRARLAGWKTESEDREATLQDILGFGM